MIARFFNTVGPRQTGRYGMVLPTFVRQGLAGEDITVYGTGEQRRCFGYVFDVIEALMRLIGTEEARGQVFNIGSNNEITIEELARLVQAKTGNLSQIVKVPYEQAYSPGFEDLGRRIPDISKLQSTIGYTLSTSVDEIVESVIESMQADGRS